MVTAPAVTPVTTPKPVIDATEGSELLQVPAGVTFAKGIVDPTQTFELPVIAATVGNGLIVTVVDCEAEHPVEVTEYVIKDEPAETPETKPVVASIVALAGVPLVQVPPAVVLASKEVAFAHKVVVPVIAGTVGEAVTVTVSLTVVVQPLVVTA